MTTTADQSDPLIIVVDPPPASTLRRERRVDTHCRVRYRTADEEWTTRLCSSLSKSGLFVATDAPREAGTMLYVELYDGERWLRARARVQWSRATDLDPWAPGGMGLQVVVHHFADELAWNALVEREQVKGKGRPVDARRPVTPDAADWLAPPDGDPSPSAKPLDSTRAREAVMLVGMTCASMCLLLIR